MNTGKGSLLEGSRIWPHIIRQHIISTTSVLKSKSLSITEVWDPDSISDVPCWDPPISHRDYQQAVSQWIDSLFECLAHSSQIHFYSLYFSSVPRAVFNLRIRKEVLPVLNAFFFKNYKIKNASNPDIMT